MNSAEAIASSREQTIASQEFVPDWVDQFRSTDGFHPAKRMREVLAGKATDATMDRLAWRSGATVIAS